MAKPATLQGFPPIDQADASFRAFRTELLAALSRRDTAYVYSIIAPEIKNTFGGDDSIAGFKRIWDLKDPNSKFWPTLTHVLQMGGKLQDSTFVAPYVYAFWPDSVDAFEYVANTRPPYNIVKRDNAQGDEFYSPVGYRAFFERRNARWKMVSLIAGD